MGLEKIDLFKKAKGWTNEDLAKASGIPKTTIDKITSGQTKDPKLETIKALVYCLGHTLNDLDDRPTPDQGITTDELEYVRKCRGLDKHGKEVVCFLINSELDRIQDEQKRSRANAYSRASKRRSVASRLSRQSASAGVGTYLGPEEFDTIYVFEDEFPRNISFCVPVCGDSMEPVYHDGDILMVSTDVNLRVGDIGVFTMDGEGYVKELGCDVLHSLNDKYDDIPLTEDIRCNGKVVGVLSPDWIVDK